MVWQLREKFPSYKRAHVLAVERPVPPPVCSKYGKLVKGELVLKHTSRFNLTVG